MRLGYELRPHAPPLWPPMSTLRRFLRLPAMLLLVGGLVLLSACDDSVTDPPVLEEEEDPDEVVITDDAVVVSPETTPIQRVAGDTLVFQISDASPEFEPGNVVVGEEGEGFLRRIVSVDVIGNEAVLITEEASLVDVVERGTLQESFQMQAALRTGPQWEVVRTAPGVTADATTLGIELDDVELPSIDLVDVVLKNGRVQFVPDIEFELSIRRQRLEQLRVAASGTLDFNLDLEIGTSDKVSYADSTSLVAFQSQPITFFIGFVPVIIVPTLEFVAGYEVEFEQTALITSGVESGNVITAGAEYENGGWGPVLDRSNSFEVRPFEWDLSASAGTKGYVRPQMSFRVYGVAGPFVYSSAFLRAQTKVTPLAWTWNLYFGLDGAFGGEISIFDNALASYSHSFAEDEWELGNDTGDFEDVVQATLSGQVTNAETGSGVEGADIVGTDASTGADLFETSTDGFGDYEITFSVEEAPDEIDVAVRADDYEDATGTIAFEEEMVLDIALNPSEDQQDVEVAISGTITDEETGEAIEAAIVSGTDPATGSDLFETTTDTFGAYETTFTVDEAPADVTVAVTANGYEAAEKTLAFAEAMEASLTLSPVGGTPPSGEATIYTASADNEVHKLTPDGAREWAYTGHTDQVNGVAVDTEGFVYTASSDYEVHKLSPDGALIWSYSGHTDAVIRVAVDAEGFVYTASVDSEVHKLTSDGELVWSFVTPFRAHIDVAVDKNGYVYTASGDRTYKLTPAGEEVWRYDEYGFVNSVAVDADGFVYTNGIVGSGSDSRYEFHKLTPDGELLWRYSEHAIVQSIGVGPNGFAHTGGSGEVHKLTPDGDPVWVYSEPRDGLGVAVDADGSVYAAAYFSLSHGVHKITPDGDLEWAYSGHSDFVSDVAVFPGAFSVSQGLLD